MAVYRAEVLRRSNGSARVTLLSRDGTTTGGLEFSRVKSKSTKSLVTAALDREGLLAAWDLTYGWERS